METSILASSSLISNMEGGHTRLQMVTYKMTIGLETNVMDMKSSRGVIEICTREN